MVSYVIWFQRRWVLWSAVHWQLLWQQVYGYVHRGGKMGEVYSFKFWCFAINNNKATAEWVFQSLKCLNSELTIICRWMENILELNFVWLYFNALIHLGMKRVVCYRVCCHYYGYDQSLAPSSIAIVTTTHRHWRQQGYDLLNEHD